MTDGPLDSRELILDELARVDTALVDARAAGDVALQGELLHRGVTLLVMLRDDDGAIARLHEALDLHLEEGGVAGLARDHYLLGLLVAKLPDGLAPAEAHLEDAAAGFRAAGEPRQRGRALVHLAVLAMRRQGWADADAFLKEAASDLADASEPVLVLHALRLWAVVLQIQRKLGDAFVVLSRSVDLANALGLREEALEIRTDLYNLEGNPLVDPALHTGTIAELISDAAAYGDPSLQAMVHLSHAGTLVRGGDVRGAADAAEQARQLALQGPDPVAYLLACLLLAEAATTGGDRVGALTVLMTCQASLGDLLGDAGRVPAIQAIESLREAWGEPAFEAAFEAYRAQFED